MFADRRFEGRNGDGRNGTDGTHGTNGTKTDELKPKSDGVVNATGSRCFVPFLDPIDGVVCLSAESTGADIYAQAAQHKLRFPLLIDRTATLRDQVNSTGYTPASSRFGPYCDNIVGMNWKLPNGHIVRLGERVVKTTTGYDLFRFLLSTGNRFGEPIDYVLRLRPDCGVTSLYVLSGPIESVSQAVPQLLKNCWMHWFDAIDFIVEPGNETGRLRLVVNCPAEECSLVESFVSGFAGSQSLDLDMEKDVSIPTDGCPDFVLKTAPENAIELAREITRSGEFRCVTICYHGVIHGYFSQGSGNADQVRKLVSKKAEGLQAVGGDWHSRHLLAAKPSELEAGWISIFEREIN